MDNNEEQKEKILNTNNMLSHLHDLNIKDEYLIYMLDTLNVAKREIALIDRFSKNIKNIHIERLDKIIALIEQCAPEYEKYDLPENPSHYEKVLIDRWRHDGYSDREIGEALMYY